MSGAASLLAFLVDDVRGPEPNGSALTFGSTFLSPDRSSIARLAGLAGHHAINGSATCSWVSPGSQLEAALRKQGGFLLVLTMVYERGSCRLSGSAT